MTEQLIVFARAKAKHGMANKMKQILLEIAENSKKLEEGCISYNILQHAEDEHFFSTSEVWASAKDEAEHWQTEHLQKSLKQLGELVDGDSDIQKFKKL